MSNSDATKPIWLFYHLQGEKGESPAHPNACRLRASTPGRVTLDDVLTSFPLSGSGVFHFRFQATLPGEKQSVFLDLINVADNVPLVNGNVVAKVLRVDSAKCSSANTPGLVFRGALAYASAATGSDGSRAGVTAQRTSASSATRSSVEAESGAMVAGAVTPAAAVIAPPVAVPDVVDADLADKSAYVQATVMARRNEVRRMQAERIAEADAREKAVLAEQTERDAAKSTLGPALDAWANDHGRVKPVRVLLSTLHTVLWEGAKWEPVPMAKLVVPAKVKFFFMRAITLVHPDKQNTMEATHRFIATAIFHALEQAYRTFQDTEMT